MIVDDDTVNLIASAQLGYLLCGFRNRVFSRCKFASLTDEILPGRFGTVGVAHGFKRRRQGIISKNNVGRIIGLEGFGTVKVFRTDENLQVSRLEEPREGKHKRKFNGDIETGTPCI